VVVLFFTEKLRLQNAAWVCATDVKLESIISMLPRKRFWDISFHIGLNHSCRPYAKILLKLLGFWPG